MKRKIIFISLLFIAIMIIITCIFYFNSNQEILNELKGEYVIALNEIEILSNQAKYDEMNLKINELQEIIIKEDIINNLNIILMGGISIILILIVFIYIYFKILRPFEKMKGYAQDLARGNFDTKLDYERGNYFGEFTWAFDSMRKEIITSRASEKAAIENNKTVIATLSHDIKTPIASIKAYSEALEANMDNTMEKRKKYIDVIINKCDEVSNLTNDLFIHSLSDLDKLKINKEELEITELINNTITELSINSNINYNKPNFKAYVNIDKNRFVQIIENLVNNSNKYAKTKIDINANLCDDSLELSIKDYGPGINDEDMPFIFDKFYRGKNSNNEQGSGLGLYIVKYIIDSFNGSILLHNNNGLEVIIKIPLKK